MLLGDSQLGNAGGATRPVETRDDHVTISLLVSPWCVCLCPDCVAVTITAHTPHPASLCDTSVQYSHLYINKKIYFECAVCQQCVLTGYVMCNKRMTQGEVLNTCMEGRDSSWTLSVTRKQLRNLQINISWFSPNWELLAGFWDDSANIMIIKNNNESTLNYLTL